MTALRWWPWCIAGLVSVGLLASCQPGQAAASPAPSHENTCPLPPMTTIHFANGNTARYLGHGPFYFGTEIGVGDWNKNPWAVDPHYKTELVIRGHRIDGGDVVNFSYWPAGLGAPSQLPDLAVSFTRQDSEGRINIFQAELRVAPEPGADHLRTGAQFWSFPSAGCYVIEATGEGVDEATTVSVR